MMVRLLFLGVAVFQLSCVNGAFNSSNFNSGKSCSADTSSPKLAGYFDGTNDYIVINHSSYVVPSTNTVEVFFKFTSGGIAQRILSFDTGNLLTYQVYLTVSNYLSVSIPGSSCTASTSLTSSGPLTVNNNYHVAVVRNGANAYLFINGTQDATAAVTVLGCTFSQTWVGNFLFGSSFFNGYIDQLRISNIARYSGSYTVPTQRLCSDSSTTLLVNFDDGTSTVEVPYPTPYTLMGGMGLVSSPFY